MASGTIKFYNQDRKYLFITGDNFEDYFAHADGIVAPHGHLCLFTTGAEVTFEYKPVKNLSRYKVQAHDVQLADTPELPFWEISQISSWFGRYGFATRPCGCSVFVHRNDFVAADISLQIGSRISHQVIDEVRNGKQTCKATEIDLYYFQEKPAPEAPSDSARAALDSLFKKGTAEEIQQATNSTVL